ncbi:Uncharacterised protein [Escherichia coli]|nr:Uncharacterised protein [Escherichia coli]
MVVLELGGLEDRSVTAGCGDVQPYHLHREPDVPHAPRTLKN